jgi:hypothetical protein
MDPGRVEQFGQGLARKTVGRERNAKEGLNRTSWEQLWACRGYGWGNRLPFYSNSNLISPDSVLTTAEDGLLMTPRVERTPLSLRATP